MLILVEVERLKDIEQKITHIFIHIAVGNASIEIINDSATVHDLANEILETIPGYLILGAATQIVAQNLRAYLKVRIVEVVRYVPAKLIVFAALLVYREFE